MGGAVRDGLLKRPVVDCDYVVIGATPEAMLAEGFLQVGRDFPVFLHPQTHEEYALARTERKSAPGYRGFVFHASPEVSLEEDLARRDLSINAMAENSCGELIDLYGGVRDLEAKVLRHISPAFAEDPVRILRVARFAARFGNFTVADDTLALMREMVQNGEIKALVAERVWQELARGLMEQFPRRMFEVLRDCGALQVLLPEVDALFGVPQRPEFHPEIDTGEHLLLCLQQSALCQAELPVRFAVLVHDLGKGTTPRDLWPRHHGHEQRSAVLGKALCQRLKVPQECREVALLTARYHGDIGRSPEMRASSLVRLIESLGAMRRPRRLKQVLLATQCDFAGRPGYEEKPFGQADYLQQVLSAMNEVDSSDISRQVEEKQMQKRQAGVAQGKSTRSIGEQIKEQIFQARVAAVKRMMRRQDVKRLATQPG